MSEAFVRRRSIQEGEIMFKFLTQDQKQYLNCFGGLIDNGVLTRKQVIDLTREQVDSLLCIMNIVEVGSAHQEMLDLLVDDSGYISRRLIILNNRLGTNYSQIFKRFYQESQLTIEQIIGIPLNITSKWFGRTPDVRVSNLLIRGRVTLDELQKLTPRQSQNLCYNGVYKLVRDSKLTLELVDSLTLGQCAQLDNEGIFNAFVNNTLPIEDIPRAEDDKIKIITEWMKTSCSDEKTLSLLQKLTNRGSVYLDPTTLIDTRQLLALLWDATHHPLIKQEGEQDTAFHAALNEASLNSNNEVSSNTFTQLWNTIGSLHPDISLGKPAYDGFLFKPDGSLSISFANPKRRITADEIQTVLLKNDAHEAAFLLEYLTYEEPARSTVISALLDLPNEMLVNMLQHQLAAIRPIKPDGGDEKGTYVGVPSSFIRYMAGSALHQNMDKLTPFLSKIMDFTPEQKKRVFDSCMNNGKNTEFRLIQVTYELSNKASDLQSTLSVKYGGNSEAAIAAKKLTEKSDTLVRAYLSSDKSDADKLTLAEGWSQAITEAKPVLEKHRGWKNILTNLALHMALFITTAGIGNVAAMAYQYHRSKGQTFFVQTDTNAGKALKEIEQVNLPIAKKKIHK